MIDYQLPIGEGTIIVKYIGDGVDMFTITARENEKIRAFYTYAKQIGSEHPGSSIELMHMGEGLWKITNETQIIVYD